MRDFGPGGQRFAEKELGWNRRTIRMGEHELRTGVECVAAFNARGRKPIDARLPNLWQAGAGRGGTQRQTPPSGGRLPASDRSDATFAWIAQFFGGPLPDLHPKGAERSWRFRTGVK